MNCQNLLWIIPTCSKIIGTVKKKKQRRNRESSKCALGSKFVRKFEDIFIKLKILIMILYVSFRKLEILIMILICDRKYFDELPERGREGGRVRIGKQFQSCQMQFRAVKGYVQTNLKTNKLIK